MHIKFSLNMQVCIKEDDIIQSFPLKRVHIPSGISRITLYNSISKKLRFQKLTESFGFAFNSTTVFWSSQFCRRSSEIYAK